MDLVTPSYGLLFWTGLTFCLLLFVLAKFAWKPILKQVNERSKKIDDALKEAENAREEMKALHSENERILKEARAERDAILKEAKDAGTKMIEEAREKAKLEGTKLLEAAKSAIQSERNAALSEMKAQVATFSVQIAEQLVKESLTSEAKQQALASKLAEEIKLN
ncbi:MAG: synthase subunit [Bacteroidota bacterium]|jgi:F-type H+-transporting ATPase subunit b|nr:ATP synthase F0 subunit B [Flavobacteriia bacterium]